MLNIVASNPLPFIVALLIGIAVAWWVWGRRASAEAEGESNVGEGEVTPTAANDTNSGDAGETAEDADPVPPVAAGSAAGAAAVAAVLPDVDAEAETEADEGDDEAPRPKIAAAVGDPDDLERIRGVGPKLDRLLASLGVLRFDQIAAWSENDVAEVDSHLGAFKGRIDRDNWIEQAKLLAEGRDDTWEQRFGGRNR